MFERVERGTGEPSPVELLFHEDNEWFHKGGVEYDDDHAL